MFLGVDGGGTKTAFCLIDGDGAILAEAGTGTSSFLSVGVEGVERVLREGVAAVCARAGIRAGDIAFAFFALPAYGESSSVVPLLDAIPRAVLGHDRYACDNDMVAGWAGSLDGADGINVIAGTGSMTYGERQGAGARCGGWGEVFGDEGSGYWIGNRALGLFARMSDGRMRSSALAERLRAHLDLSADFDLVDVVLNRWKGDRGRIASLAKLVAEAAADGDPNAAAIMAEAAAELALLVEATAARLGFTAAETVPVSYSGGLFQPGSGLLDLFAARLGALGSHRYELRAPLHRPVAGAARHARRLAQKSLARRSAS